MSRPTTSYTDQLIPVAVTEQAIRTPRAIAVCTERKEMTYHELEERTNRLARFLRSRGVTRNHLVGVMVERNDSLLVSLLGVLKAGGAYVPMDPQYPALRLKGIVETTAVDIILTESHLAHRFQEIAGGNAGPRNVLFVDLAEEPAGRVPVGVAAYSWQHVAAFPATAPELINEPLDLCCVLFTSGSTGKPKGVMIHHKAVMNCLTSAIRDFEITDADRVIAVSSMSFDMSVFELFAALMTGGRVYIATADTVRDPWRAVRYLQENRITIWHSVPTTWALWLNLVDPNRLPDLDALRLVFLGGEQLLPDYVRRSMTLFPKTTVVNIYGPTETTVWMSANPITAMPGFDMARLNAGRPIQNVAVVICDEEMNPCPAGEVGEICIGGMCLSPGYLNDPERTESVFVRHPLSGERIYKTGDLGRLLEDGSIDIIGRKDMQVKIRGHRVEIGEIESVAVELPGIKQAVVILDSEKQDLHCFITRSHPAVTEDDLRAFLKDRLPPYMLPHKFAVVESIPVNPNGKTDRQSLAARLKERGTGNSQEQSAAPRREAVEKSVIDAWGEVLGNKGFGPDDSFFDVGGDSLKAVKVKMALDEQYPDTLEVADLFANPTVRNIIAHIESRLGPFAAAAQAIPAEPVAPVHIAAAPASAPTVAVPAEENAGDGIAIIGMSCRFPGGSTPEEFWQTLANKVDAVREVPKERWDVAAYYDPDPMARDKTNCRWGGFIDGIDQFDANFFNISPKEAALIDPQQRLMLEVVYEALENAGYAARRSGRSETGVFVAGSNSDHAFELLRQGKYNETYGIVGNQPAMLANRISYLFNLAGPSMFIDTACSSSLVAIHQACRSLLNNECEMAIVGGVALNVHPYRFIAVSKMLVVSPTGRCRTFDRSADGFVPGEGGGAVLLKPLAKALSDRDQILGVIKGSAVNHGGKAIGLTAPNPVAQEEVIRKAYGRAKVTPDTVSLIEAHGTGTQLGDPIELRALANVFPARAAGAERIPIGSVKTVIGHAGEAAGLAGLIKVLLALKHRQIPPSLHFEAPNPGLRLEESPFYVNTNLIPWNPAGPRRAGISSFGLGGTNAHVIVEEAPRVERKADGAERKLHVLALSAKSSQALRRRVADMGRYIRVHPETSLADLCFTANTGRAHFPHRVALVISSLQELDARLEALEQADARSRRDAAANSKQPVLALSDDNGQLLLIGQELYRTHAGFRKHFHACLEHVDQMTAFDLVNALGAGQSSDAVRFVIGASLAKLWTGWVPESEVVGAGVLSHVADCLAGRATVQQTLKDLLSGQAARDAGMAVPEGTVVSVGLNAAGGGVAALLAELAGLYVRGAEIDWEAFDAGFTRSRVALPTYPYERQRFWHDADTAPAASEPDAGAGVAAATVQVAAALDRAPVAEAPDAGPGQAEAGEQPETPSHTREEVEEILMNAIRSLLKDQVVDFDVDTDLFDLDFDSLAVVELVNTVAGIVGVRIQPRDVFNYPTVRQLAAHVVMLAAAVPLPS